MQVVWIAIAHTDTAHRVVGAVVAEAPGYALTLARQRFPETSRVQSAASFAVAWSDLDAANRRRTVRALGLGDD